MRFSVFRLIVLVLDAEALLLVESHWSYCGLRPQLKVAGFKKFGHTVPAARCLLSIKQLTDTVSDQLMNAVKHLAAGEPNISLRREKKVC